jgi:hypothetical protein
LPTAFYFAAVFAEQRDDPQASQGQQPKGQADGSSQHGAGQQPFGQADSAAFAVTALGWGALVCDSVKARAAPATSRTTKRAVMATNSFVRMCVLPMELWSLEQPLEDEGWSTTPNALEDV